MLHRPRSPAATCCKTAGVRLRLPGLRRPGRTQAAAAAARTRWPPKAPHFPARAKRVIFLCMDGGPSHVDTFDYKPKLDKPTTARPSSARPARHRAAASCWRRRGSSRQHGESGLWISELFPERRQARRRPVPPQRHAHRRAEPPAGVPAAAHRRVPVRPAVAGRVGALRPGHREREPARLRHHQPAARQRRRRRTTAAPSCPPSTRARASASRARRSPGASIGNLDARSWPPTQQRRQLDLVQAMNQRPARSASRSTRSSKASSSRTSWPSACRASCRELMDLSKRDRRRRWSCTASATGRSADRRMAAAPTTSAGSACWPGGSSRRACASSRSASGGWDHARRPEGRPDAAAARPIDQPIAGLLDRPEAARPARRTRWSSGAASSAARRPARAPTAATTTPPASRIWMAGGGVKGGLALRRDRRVRLRGRREQGPHPRLARDHPAPARPRPREADLPLRRPRLPPDRHSRPGRQGSHGLETWTNSMTVSRASSRDGFFG